VTEYCPRCRKALADLADLDRWNRLQSDGVTRLDVLWIEQRCWFIDVPGTCSGGYGETVLP
jgi:hypothetical protein